MGMQLKTGKASRQKWKVESMRLNKFKDLNAESAHFQRQAELVHTKLAKAVIKFSKYKQEQASTNKDDATMSLSKAQHMNDVRLHQLRKRTADSYLVEAENANEHRFTWKAQKAEWKSQSARKKLSRAAVVLTVATAARDEAATKYGRKSDKYRHAENNFAQAEEASTRVKAAYKQYALKVAGASNPHGVTVETQGNKVVVTMPKGATKAGSNSSSVQVVDGQNAAVVAAKMAGQNAVKKDDKKVVKEKKKADKLKKKLASVVKKDTKDKKQRVEKKLKKAKAMALKSEKKEEDKAKMDKKIDEKVKKKEKKEMKKLKKKAATKFRG